MPLWYVSWRLIQESPQGLPLLRQHSFSGLSLRAAVSQASESRAVDGEGHGKNRQGGQESANRHTPSIGVAERSQAACLARRIDRTRLTPDATAFRLYCLRAENRAAWTGVYSAAMSHDQHDGGDHRGRGSGRHRGGCSAWSPRCWRSECR